MRILYLLGNGFDLNLGLKTAYKDFYNYYSQINSDNPEVKLLKASLNTDIKNWSDLELGFGEYIGKFEDFETFESVYDDMTVHLSDYLNSEQKKIKGEHINKTEFFDNLEYPESFLPYTDRVEMQSFKRNEHYQVNVITFNYTEIVENILEGNSNNVNINGKIQKTPKSKLENIHHIHGFTHERMILGVNDEDQIKNSKLLEDVNFREILIKQTANKAAKNGVELRCKELIENSDLICIFGSSLGETDRYWWKLIGKRLQNNVRVIIFNKGIEIDKRTSFRLGSKERLVKNNFFKAAGLTPEQIAACENKIYVSLNSEMFGKLLIKDSPEGES